MKSANRSNALLVELLIVALFFMLASPVLLDLYSTARNQSVLSGNMTSALNQVQNVADRLFVEEDTEAALQDMGFERQENGWAKKTGYGSIVVTAQEESTPAGILLKAQVSAQQEDQLLFTLPVTRYQEVRHE